MRILVTGSSGHLGEGLMRVLPQRGHDAVGLDVLPGPFTHHVGSIADPGVVEEAMADADAVLHAATLHKPHVATHSRQAFVDTNITGTLTLLEAAARHGAGRFVFTSTTSAFGAAMNPPSGAPAAWIEESVVPVPKNIYGTTKTAAEDLCALAHRRDGLAVVVLRTSRFFPEDDDDGAVRERYADGNSKANEFLFRRVDIADAVEAHLDALRAAPQIGFGRYIVSATTPFTREDCAALGADAPAVLAHRVPRYRDVYAAAGFAMFDTIDRVYDNARARRALGWRPLYDFEHILDQLGRGDPIGSDLARLVGSKGYHEEVFEDGPFPVE